MAMEKLWSALIHLGGNMWNEEGNWNGRAGQPGALASPVLRCDRDLWNKYMEDLVRVGGNAVIIDVGEGMLYESHPELAVKGSWTKDEVAAEVARLRAMGLEPIPKLNFSAGHDIWLQEYSYMLATQKYRDVCADLIGEVCEVFKPKYFHIGMDEENAGHQKNFDFAVMRQFDLWWHDLYYFVDCVERNNARAWVWSDYIWNHTDEYLAKMPKTVLQNNWYYSDKFDGIDEKYAIRLKSYELLDKHGFDQIPTCSMYEFKPNIKQTLAYCKDRLSEEHLKGVLVAPWVSTNSLDSLDLKRNAERLYLERKEYYPETL